MGFIPESGLNCYREDAHLFNKAQKGTMTGHIAHEKKRGGHEHSIPAFIISHATKTRNENQILVQKENYLPYILSLSFLSRQIFFLCLFFIIFLVRSPSFKRDRGGLVQRGRHGWCWCVPGHHASLEHRPLKYLWK